MLDSLFIKVLDMTLAGSAVIVIVILARLMLKKAPKVFSYALWAVVLWRLLCPVELTASVGVLPQRESVGESYSLAREEISFADATYAAQQAVGDAINGGLGVQHIPTTEKTQAGSTVYVTYAAYQRRIAFSLAALSDGYSAAAGEYLSCRSCAIALCTGYFPSADLSAFRSLREGAGFYSAA